MLAVSEESIKTQSSLLEGLLDRISELMGDAVSMSAFRYAAFEEGKRLGEGVPRDDISKLVERVDGILGQQSEVESDHEGSTRLRVAGSRLLGSDRPIVQGIALGVFEGAFLAARGARHSGKVLSGGGDSVVIQLEVAKHE